MLRWLALAAVCVASTSARADAPADRRTDEHSYAEPARVRVKRLRLELRADFAAKQLAGTAALTLEWLQRAAPHRLILDTRDLVIEKVEVPGERGAWRAVPFALGKRDPILGSPLTITLDRAHPEVRVAYRTQPQASGLQWLPPALTADGKHPFLFTQSQSIHARSWVPLQDTPGVRFTYSARIQTPKELVAVMSAANDPALVRDGDHAIEMREPIPSYLLALAIGDLAFKPISPRTGVWAERSVVDRAAAEFADTEKMLAAAEALFGPSRWGRYDLLILPPSFPFGGMENPRLSFITPTLIVGDRSLVALIAHELAHSWAGNLVTNATWKDSWLNEGVTTYLENRIVEAVYGRELAEMEVVLAQTELRAELQRAPKHRQRLRMGSLAGLDPSEDASAVEYEKGQWFLLTLERRFGRAAFDAFLRRWFDRFAFQSVTTDDFVALLRGELIAKQPKAITDAELAAWLDGDGVPAGAVPATSKRLAAVDAARASWLAKGTDLAGQGAARWSTHERVHFLDGLPRTLPRPKLVALERALGLSSTPNGEVARRWYVLAIRSGYAEARPAIAAFVARIGRLRYVEPIYEALAATLDGRAFARRTFERAKPGYHPITVAAIEKVLAAPPPPPRK